MSRLEELDDEKALAAYHDDQRFFAKLLAYVAARAPRCSVGICQGVALWVAKDGSRGYSAERLLCDGHKEAGAVEVLEADVIRGVKRRMGK